MRYLRDIPKRQNTKPRPLDYVVSGEWPHAELQVFAPALFAQSFAQRLEVAMDGQSLREAARMCDLDPMTVRALLRGERFPDSVSITKLELAYRRLLWPADSDRRRVIREIAGDDPEVERERTERQLFVALDALAASWEDFTGTPFATDPAVDQHLAGRNTPKPAAKPG